MKASDLMIGDLVYGVWYINPTTRYVVTVDISVLKAMEDATFFKEAYEPIPLTDEILLKNGFVLDETDESASIWNNEGYRITLFKEINSNEFWLGGYYGSITFTYVHELQHLLRLANISKDIEVE